MKTTKELLCDLIRIRSVSTDIPEVNRCVDFLRAELESDGLFCAEETFAGGRKALWASNIAGKRPDLLVVVHLDVVPVDSDAQFEPVVDGDTVSGRGALDCKGNAVAAIGALREVLADAASGASIGVIFTTDEEIGGATTAGMVARGYGAAKAALVYDCGAKSNLFIGQKGIAGLRLVARGKGGHSSCPWNLDNPIYTLAEALVRLRAYWEAKYPHVAGEDWHNSLAPCILSAGQAGNQIPDTAAATLNVRFIETSTPEEIAAEVRRATGLEVELLESSPCCLFPSDSPAIETLCGVISESFGVAEVRRYRMSGGTDARHLVRLGVPVAVTGIAGKGPHQSDENASLSSIDRFARIAAGFARRLVRMRPEIRQAGGV